MEYKVVATSYEKKHLIHTTAGWLRTPLPDLTEDLNKAIKENWKVKQMCTADADTKVIFTFLLEKD